MIGSRSTLPACNCIYRLYDCGIYRRINAELPSRVYDVPIDDAQLLGYHAWGDCGPDNA
jgi:hypothetical protein